MLCNTSFLSGVHLELEPHSWLLLSFLPFSFPEKPVRKPPHCIKLPTSQFCPRPEKTSSVLTKDPPCMEHCGRRGPNSLPLIISGLSKSLPFGQLSSLVQLILPISRHAKAEHLSQQVLQPVLYRQALVSPGSEAGHPRPSHTRPGVMSILLHTPLLL